METCKCDTFKDYQNGKDADLWYRARNFVLNVLPALDGNGIKPNSKKHVHVILENMSDIMLAVARQIALIAHYPNYDDVTGLNKTIIALCNCENLVETNTKRITAYNPEMTTMGNLLTHCKCTYVDSSKDEVITVVQEEKSTLPLDVEFVFTTEDIKSYQSRVTSDNDMLTVIYERDIPQSYKSELDENKGRLVNMVYNVGKEINNLPSTDNANIERYDIALKAFCYNLKVENIDEKWHGGSITDKLSSIFCADCFEYRLKSILDVEQKSLCEYLLEDFDTVQKALKKNINPLVKSEHARWNVEKLILGFRPLNAKEKFNYECKFGDERKAEIKSLKNNFIHIDLCSYRELRRVDLGNMKYDFFLMLAMPQILRVLLKEY